MEIDLIKGMAKPEEAGSPINDLTLPHAAPAKFQYTAETVP